MSPPRELPEVRQRLTPGGKSVSRLLVEPSAEWAIDLKVALADGELPARHRDRVAGIDHEVILRAAFVPRPIHVSGWDMAAGAPKPTSRMVAPGAVYFFERADGKPFGEAEAQSLWLAVPATRTDEGFLRVVAGVWRPNGAPR